MLRQVAILGTPIHDLTMDETLDCVESFIARGGFHQVATANTDFLVKAQEDVELRSILRRCDLVVADGMPLLWASRLLGVPLRERVTGADLVPRLAALSAAKGYRIFLLGATEESSRLAAENMQRDYPGVQIVGRMCPPIAPLESMNTAAILRQIKIAKPDILLVAFGNPKQEKWLDRHRASLNDVPVCVGVGASIDFMGGVAPRAPRWMQTSGLEWIHRMALDPGRLARGIWWT